MDSHCGRVAAMVSLQRNYLEMVALWEVVGPDVLCAGH